jgi:hypothetical protein
MWVKGFWIAYFADGFGDSGDYARNRDRDQDIDDDGFCGFVGCGNLFDDFSLIIDILFELTYLIR